MTVISPCCFSMMFQLSFNPDTRTSEAESTGPPIPGLDFSQLRPDAASSDVITSDARPHGLPRHMMMMTKKPIFTKPVPKAFERAWTEGRQPTGIGLEQMEPEMHSIPGLLGDTPGLIMRTTSAVLWCNLFSLNKINFEIVYLENGLTQNHQNLHEPSHPSGLQRHQIWRKLLILKNGWKWRIWLLQPRIT